MIGESFYRDGIAHLALSPKQAAGMLKEAKKAFKRTVSHCPKGDYLAESARFRLGELAFNLGKYDEAIEAMENLTREYPMGLLRGEARILEAEALMAEQKFSQADKLLDLALKEQPAYARTIIGWSCLGGLPSLKLETPPPRLGISQR